MNIYLYPQVEVKYINRYRHENIQVQSDYSWNPWQVKLNKKWL